MKIKSRCILHFFEKRSVLMTRNLRTEKFGRVERKTFSRTREVQPIPDLIEIQKDSYETFIREGIQEVFEDFSPITDFSDHFELYFLDHTLATEPKYSEKECRDRDVNYAVKLSVKVRLVNKVTGEIMDKEVFMGELPKMTETGSFIISGLANVNWGAVGIVSACGAVLTGIFWALHKKK
jgi:DNA-directed RNA polymerase subunit beta